MFTSFEDTIAYLFNRFPAFQNNGSSAYKPGLERVFQLCELLGNPQNQFKSIHVAGTNGKGSVCSSLASIYREAGYEVGLYTSPHMIDFRERIRIDGEMISKDEVVDFVNTHLESFQEIDPSFFEWSTVLAFYKFAKENVDIAIIETGLGGRLDATNVITPEMSVITSIGIDHIGYLGDTLEQIAVEKGGIIKKGVPVVIGDLGKKSSDEINTIANSKDSKLIQAKKDFKFESSLKGEHQEKNKDIVITVIEELSKTLAVTEQKIQLGLENISRNSGLRGRYETLQDSPKIIADIAHNEQAVEALVCSLIKEVYVDLHIVIGMVDDKEVEKVIQMFPKAYFYCCQPDNKRGLPSEKLVSILQKHRSEDVFIDCKTCAEAFIQAKDNLKESDILLVTGSNFVVSEIAAKFY